MLQLLLSFTALFTLTALLNLLAACPPTFLRLRRKRFSTLIPILSTSLLQELNNIFTLSFLLLVNSGTLYLNLYFYLPTTWTHLREEYQYTCNSSLASLSCLPSFFREPAIRMSLFIGGKRGCNKEIKKPLKK